MKFWTAYALRGWRNMRSKLFSVNASLSSLHRKTILPQNDGKPTEIPSTLAPAEFAKLSGLKETSFTWKEVSESEVVLSKNAQIIRLKDLRPGPDIPDHTGLTIK